MKNIFKYFSIIFGLVIGIFVLDAKVANAYALYYSDSSALGVKYDTDGYVTDVSDSVVVYGQQINANYTIANSSSLRIKEVKVTVGSSTSTISSDYYSVTSITPNTVPTGYSLTVNKTTDKFVFKMQDILDDYFSSYSSSNDITISISLEKKKVIVFVPSWSDYTSISYYNGAGTATTGVKYKRADAALLNAKIALSTGTFTSPNSLNGEKYYSKAVTSTSGYYFRVRTPFKLSSGTAKVNYKNSAGTSFATSARTFTNYSTYSNVDLNSANFTNMFANGVYEKYTFQSVNITATDLYGNLGNATISVNDGLTVATKSPEIKSISLSSDVTEAPGAIAVKTSYDLSSLDFTNNSYTVTLTSIEFNVGSSTVKKTDGTKYTNSEFKSSKKIQKVYNIYSNEGTGVITFKRFSATLIDKYGNTKTYTNNTSITHSETSMTLKSNADGSKFDSNYIYYYNGETITFDLEVNVLVNTTISGISLVDDSGNTYDIYSTLITKTSEGVQEFSLTSSKIAYNSTTTWSKVRLLDVCYDSICDDYDIDHLLYFNNYKTLESEEEISNGSTFNLENVDSESATFTYTDIDVENYGNASISISGCVLMTDDINYGRCSYSNAGGDGYAEITVNRGVVRLLNGQKNEELILTLVENKSNPTATFSHIPVNSDGTDSNDQVYYDSTLKSYFYTGTKQVSVTLNDGYCGSGALYYRFNEGEYTKITFSCTGNVLTSSSLNLILPSDDDEYTLDYYVETDGLEKSTHSVTYSYVSRNNLDLDTTIININNDAFFETKQEEYFNAINVGINNVSALSLLNKYRIQFIEDLAYTDTTLNVGDNTFRYDSINRESLANLNGEEVSFTITLFDKLGNYKEYEYTVIVDTTIPESPDPRVSGTSGNYVITVSNYDKYTDGDIITISYGADVEKYCVKGENSDCKFTINANVYSLKSTDKAGNTYGVTTYTTEESKVELSSADLQVWPFLDTVYTISEDVTIKVYKYEYTEGEIASYTTITRGCTNVTTSNCYSTYKLTKSSMYVYSENELNIKLSTFGLKDNYTYLFIVTLGNSSLPLENSQGEYPRLNLEYKDSTGPELIANSVSSNPVVVSDSLTSSNTFTFNFTVSDTNLDNDSYFEYLIINKTKVSGYTLTNDKFKDYLSYCPRNLSTYADACGQWSTSAIEYASVNGTNASGVITISKNGKMINNASYLLFVKAYDANGNYTIAILNEFVNISDSVDVYYRDGDEGSKTLATNNVIKTVNANANLIVETKTLLNSDVSISSITLNGTPITNSYRVGQGIHTLVVTDTLGNVETITVYCGALSKPEIKVYNYYNDAYYEISSDSTYAYNSTTLTNLYVRIVATNLQDFAINDGNTDTVYVSSDEEYVYITNGDDAHEYGVKLSDLISETTGTVTISATGDGGEVSSIELVVDNEVPTIRIVAGLAESTVYLFDNAHSIKYNQVSGKYDLEPANYRYELNYEYLFSSSKLDLVVDNKSFEEMKEISNLIIKLDSVRITDYTTPIATKSTGSELSIEYFDDAGNIASPLYITLKIVDKEAPVLEGLEENRIVEANTSVAILDETVIAKDNFDYPDNISIKVMLNSSVLFEGKYNTLKENKHNFNIVGTYNLTFTLTDTTGNVSQTYNQTISALDTTSPLISDAFSLTSFALGQTQIIDLPRFIDTDVSSTVYYPSVIEFYMGETLVEDKYYSLTIDNDSATIRFNDDAKLGNYTILLKAIDVAGNASIVTTTFVLTDTTAPIINVYVNGVKVDSNNATIVFGDANYTFTYEAIDAHDGKVSVSKTGQTINVNKEGDYLIRLTAKDKSGVEAVREFTIKVAPDTEKPIINKLKIGNTMLIPSNESMPIYNDLNYKYEIIDLEVKDNAGVDYTEIKYDGTVASNKSQVRLIDGRSFIIEVKVVDTSGNITTANYYIRVDNSTPRVNGVEDKKVYDSGVDIAVSDANLVSVALYKNNSLIDEHESASNYNKSISGVGVYEIVAMDSYKNETRYVFEIKDKLSHTIKYGDGSQKEVKNNGTFLVKTEVGSDESLLLYFANNSLIEDDDQVYILVNYPGTNYMKEIYSTNGAYYNSHDSINIAGTIISGESNIDTLENIGSDYYAYVMVIKANSNLEDTTEDEGEKTTLSPALKSFLTTIGIIALAAIIIIIIIKSRRKVRAV